MKKLAAIVVGILFLGATALMFNTYAVAGPGHPGHHGHHWPHGPHWGGWGFGNAVVWGAAPLVVDSGCYMVKRCRINDFGEKRCRWVEVCD